MEEQEEREKVVKITDKLITLLEGVGFNIEEVKYGQHFFGVEQHIFLNNIPQVINVRARLNSDGKRRIIIGVINPTDPTGDTICSISFEDKEYQCPDLSPFVNECVDKFGLKN